MAVELKFDESHNILQPTFVLTSRSGHKEGLIPAHSITFQDNFNAYSEISFTVHKSDCDPTMWKSLVDLKLLWYKELNAMFELTVSIDEENDLVKNCSAKSLGVAELSQVNLYNIEINTETDIARDAYVPTVLWQPDNVEGSLLHRMMEKIPHYTVAHVDSSLRNIQRTYTFDGESIYDCFNDIAQEIGCIFDLRCYFNNDDKLLREIYVFDMESTCNQCHYRGEFQDVCPECGSTDISEGYGTDTTVLVTVDNLAGNITYTTDIGSVKNCFRLQAGDDLMTSTVMNCNPNGGPYIWYFSQEMLDDMPDELVQRITEYQKQYEYYEKDYPAPLDESLINQYNALVDKYSPYDKTLQKIPTSVVGFPALMEAYYNTVDLALFLQHELMPNTSLQTTTASKEAAKLTAANMNPIAVTNLEAYSLATASGEAESIAKILVDSRYRVKVNEGASLAENTWIGTFTVTNYSDEEDTATTPTVRLNVTDDYQTFVQKKVDKALSQADLSEDVYDIVDIFKLDDTKFAYELQKYCLERLKSFHDACEACLSVLIEQGVADYETWGTGEVNLYEQLYIPFRNKLAAIEQEIKVREEEIGIVLGTYDSDGMLSKTGVQPEIDKIRDEIAKNLDFETFLGHDLWLIFCAYRREDSYSNSNYISDGLDNSQLFKNALEFIENAKKDIYKSATLQHSISASLKNLLVMKEFEPIVKHFAVGNWIRIRVDNEIYKLRLLSYEIDFDALDGLSVEFSDVLKVRSGITDTDDVLSQMQSMSSSYDAVKHQAHNGQDGADAIESWKFDGFHVDNFAIMNNAKEQDIKWDSNGIWLREFLSEYEGYDDRQMRIINRGLYLTDDGWETSKAAIGNFYFKNPKTGQTESVYGVNGELIVGELILGEELGIYTQTGGMMFDNDGLKITNNLNTFLVNPNSDELLQLLHGEEKLLYVNDQGDLCILGNIMGGSININNNFLVDEFGNVTLNGSITWGTGGSPTQAVYNSVPSSKPTNGTKFDTFPQTGQGVWHTLFDVVTDFFACYTYDGGNTWTDPIKIRGEDGAPGRDGEDGTDGEDGSDATVTRSAIVEAMLEAVTSDGLYTVQSSTGESYLGIRASAILIGDGDNSSALFIGKKNVHTFTDNRNSIDGKNVLDTQWSITTKTENKTVFEISTKLHTTTSYLEATTAWADMMGCKDFVCTDLNVQNIHVHTGLTVPNSYGLKTYTAPTNDGLVGRNEVTLTYMSNNNWMYYGTAGYNAQLLGTDNLVIGVEKGPESSDDVKYTKFLQLQGESISFYTNQYWLDGEYEKIPVMQLTGGDIYIGSRETVNTDIYLTDVDLHGALHLSPDGEIQDAVGNHFLGSNYLTFYQEFGSDRTYTQLFGLDVYIGSSSTSTIYFKASSADFDCPISMATNNPLKNNGLTLINQNGGNVFVGDNSGITVLRGSSVTLKTTSGSTVTSDLRNKYDIESISDPYESFMMRIQPVKFKYNNGKSGRYHIGFVAQDVMDALIASGLDSTEFGGYVDLDGTGELGLIYSEFISLNTYMIQKLYRRIEDLERKIELMNRN